MHRKPTHRSHENKTHLPYHRRCAGRRNRRTGADRHLLLDRRRGTGPRNGQRTADRAGHRHARSELPHGVAAAPRQQGADARPAAVAGRREGYEILLLQDAPAGLAAAHHPDRAGAGQRGQLQGRPGSCRIPELPRRRTDLHRQNLARQHALHRAAARNRVDAPRRDARGHRLRLPAASAGAITKPGTPRSSRSPPAPGNSTGCPD